MKLTYLWVNNREDPEIENILERLRELRLPDYEDWKPIDIWEKSSEQMVEYYGNPEVRKIISNILGTKYSGEILEAMCGSESYFDNLCPRTNITLLDYCKTALEKHRFPERKRVCCDLNQIGKRGDLGLFSDNQFDVISICFGIKYPDNLDILSSEFLRILKPGGILSFFENENSEYKRLRRRSLDIPVIKKMFLDNDYSSFSVRHVNMSDVWNEEAGRFYHLEAVK